MKLSRIIVYGCCLILAGFVVYTYRHLLIYDLLESKEVVFDPQKNVPELPDPEWETGDWPIWRGPNKNNVAQLSGPAFELSEDRLLWQVDIPGRGHGSPIVLGDKVFLPTADETNKTQNLLAFNLQTGSPLWNRPLHRGRFDSNTHYDNSHASSTPACDGERVFTVFLNDQAVWLSAVSLTGEILWQTRCGRFVSEYGLGTSPTLSGALVFVVADHEEGGFLVAVHRQTGDIIWKKPRPSADSNSSPIVANLDGKDQLLASGCEQGLSYDPQTGESLWSFPEQSKSCVGTIVPSDSVVLANSGFRGSETVCVRADGSGEILWHQTMRCHVPSILEANGSVFAVNDDGIAVCLDLKTGEEKWKERLSENFSASPLLASDAIYACSERGRVVVFRASAEKYEQIAESHWGDEIYSSPVIAHDRLLLRSALTEGESRNETLYCFGRP